MNALKALRRQAEMTQAQVAKSAGVSQGYYCRLERGEKGKRLPVRTAQRLASALGCSLAQLLYGGTIPDDPAQ
ncbi:MAG: helix-turn-helix transcriptional regulator [Oscillospiraceae bacterium]|jgi:transcriptional regulator with XRE-family HTH domain|nr:helix-turn-helix transcriptional regulator [Oscillospiraceae bacterium]